MKRPLDKLTSWLRRVHIGERKIHFGLCHNICLLGVVRLKSAADPDARICLTIYYFYRRNDRCRDAVEARIAQNICRLF